MIIAPHYVTHGQAFWRTVKSPIHTTPEGVRIEPAHDRESRDLELRNLRVSMGSIVPGLHCYALTQPGTHLTLYTADHGRITIYDKLDRKINSVNDIRANNDLEVLLVTPELEAKRFSEKTPGYFFENSEPFADDTLYARAADDGVFTQKPFRAVVPQVLVPADAARIMTLDEVRNIFHPYFH